MEPSIQQSGSCHCGKVQISMSGKPLFRAYCHCLICQEFNEADFADVTVFYRKDVALADQGSVKFRVYQQPPFVRRGKCVSCGKPAIEKLTIPFMPRMTVVPSINVSDPAFLPEPALHIFYHRRKAEALDNVPKYSGFLNSQSHFVIAAVRAMFRGNSH